MNDWSKELEVAMDAATQAAELALKYQPNIVADTKPDKSPVTQADRECERMIARLLNDAFPMTAFWAKRERARKAAAGGVGLSIPLMALETMCAEILCGPTSSRWRKAATWWWVW